MTFFVLQCESSRHRILSIDHRHRPQTQQTLFTLTSVVAAVETVGSEAVALAATERTTNCAPPPTRRRLMSWLNCLIAAAVSDSAATTTTLLLALHFVGTQQQSQTTSSSRSIIALVGNMFIGRTEGRRGLVLDTFQIPNLRSLVQNIWMVSEQHGTAG